MSMILLLIPVFIYNISVYACMLSIIIIYIARIKTGLQKKEIQNQLNNNSC